MDFGTRLGVNGAICFIVDPLGEPASLVELGSLVETLGYRPSVVASLTDLRHLAAYREADRPLVLVCDPDSSDVIAESVGQFAQSELDHSFIVYVADRIEPQTYKRLVRSRGAEWMAWDALSRELVEFVGGLHQVQPAPGAARIVSCLPSKGGVGNTILAVEIAVQLAAKRKRRGRVAALELSFQGGTLADALDLQPRFDVQDVMRNPERLDAQLIDVYTSTYSNRLDVFAATPRLIAADLFKPEVIFAFIDAISTRYDVVVLDLPNLWQPWTDSLLRGSDRVVVAGGSTVPAVKRIIAKLAQLSELGIGDPKVSVVVNQCETDMFGRITRRNEIGRAIPGTRIFYVRRDCETVETALNTGRPLMETAPGSKVVKEIRAVSDWVESAALPVHSAANSARAGTS